MSPPVTSERILCAAIHVDDGVERVHLPRNIKTGMVFAGWRHHNCFVALTAVFGTPEEANRGVSPEQRAGRDQGFLTSQGRFVNREEGAVLAKAAGQLDHLDYDVTSLMSEHLY